MREIIAWLSDIESRANQSYLQAAQVFADDPQVRAFLEQNAEDEAWHYRIMADAREFFGSHPAITPAIVIDDELRHKIDAYFSEMTELVARRSISSQELTQRIVEAELSEWNDIFIYVVNTLKEKGDRFTYPAASIQIHLKRIISFLEDALHRPDILARLKTVPPVWTENILIVDDDEAITVLMKSLLNKEGNIDVARNGLEALEAVGKTFYKLVITDITMPGMDGVAFFREAVAKYPSLKNRFLFLSGYISDEHRVFLGANQVSHFTKPVGIKALREAAKKIILSD